MGKKYIIEIPDDKIGDFIGSTHFLMPYMMAGHIGHHDTGLPIEPYTEPDMEQVRKKAYQSGYETAKHECEDCTKPLDNGKAYQQGLTDAWEAARTLWNTTNRKAIFGYTTFSVTLTTLTAQEAIEKIRQYERRQEEDGLRQNIQTIVDQCGYSLDEIAEVLAKMKKS